MQALYYVALALRKLEGSITVNGKEATPTAEDGMIGFLPVFETRTKAEEAYPKCEILTVRTGELSDFLEARKRV